MKHLFDKVNDSVKLVLKTFQNIVKNKSRIPQSLVEKHKYEICFMVDTDFTYIEVVEPRMEFIDPLGYEISEAKIVGYVNRLLKCDLDGHANRFGTYEENFNSAISLREKKQSSKRVESTMKKILKESGISSHEFDIAKKTVEALKQSENLVIPPEASSADPVDPIAVKVKVEVPEKDEGDKSFSPIPRKRVKVSATRPGKRQKMIVPPVPRNVAVIKDDDVVSIKKKTWKPRIERVNEDILKHGDFTKLNKFYDLYGSFDRLNFENAMITHMIVIDKKLSTIHGKIPSTLR